VEENYVNNGMSDDLSNSKGSNKQQWCRVNSKLSWRRMLLSKILGKSEIVYVTIYAWRDTRGKTWL